MEEIMLNELFNDLGDEEHYKLHFARKSGTSEPLDAYANNFQDWKEWNTYGNGKNEFNRTYIFSLISFYPEVDTWLFGGIWKVNAYDRQKGTHPYSLELVDKYQKYIGRLKIKYKYTDRTARPCFEKHFKSMAVKELLKEPYSVMPFPGYKNIDLPYRQLKTLMDKDATEWKKALSIKGIYLIIDTKTGKRYVGKADGEHGLWQRWGDYVKSGHGGDKDLEKLVEAKGMGYVEEHFKFSILETITGWEELEIDARESHWKRVLLSRNAEFGHNKN